MSCLDKVCQFLHINPNHLCLFGFAAYAGWITTSRRGGRTGRTPDHTLCACCGAEFGYHDATAEAARQFRGRWLENGAEWFYPNVRPAGWQLPPQLAQIPAIYQ